MSDTDANLTQASTTPCVALEAYKSAHESALDLCSSPASPASPTSPAQHSASSSAPTSSSSAPPAEAVPLTIDHIDSASPIEAGSAMPQDEPTPNPVSPDDQVDLVAILDRIKRRRQAEAEAELHRDATTYPPDARTEENNVNVEVPGQAGSGMVTDALQIRLSLAGRVIASLAQGKAGRDRLIVTTVIGIIAWSVVLARTTHSTCVKPLRLYLILIIIKLAVQFPFAFYRAVTPPVRMSSDSEQVIAQREATRLVGSPALDRRVKRVKDLVWLYSLVLFVIGNVWVFGASQCRPTAPMLWKASVAALIISYLSMFEAFAVILVVMLYLPFALYNLGSYMAPAQNEIGPISKKEIAKLPKRIFIGTKSEATTAAPSEAAAACEGEATTSGHPPLPPPIQTNLPPNTKVDSSVPPSPAPSKQGRPRRLHLLWRSARKRTLPQGPSTSDATSSDFVDLPVPGILVEPSQSACSICLGEYELPPARGESIADWEPELLHLLPCGHCFHVYCTETWLATSGRCPVCSTPVSEEGRRKREESQRRAQEDHLGRAAEA
ncbi:BZ3500_MvSof-1268-A1-R1_Chr7-3g09645 [Microbotryum saponariae]|uniref:BZ3500_MvSof-1268-A1-R1_Chr7-3g09645 protein n=1 Tax=Microbotryum saponariae TaxID=289078 RepID=A0A2X0KVB3_9BASI|nr:BZ3501_MvSof-1269-A2-R1_Chr7-2g09368 [Microbotryum saponariae]SDA02339.1 BZ3500_MvSof-1268-A1-R1_Chr7-3g09645 [Microbotryum saponariae]